MTEVIIIKKIFYTWLWEVMIDEQKCIKCEACSEACFVLAITMQENAAVIGNDCTGCGICIQHCPEGAISLTMENEEEMFTRLLNRVREMSKLPLKTDFIQETHHKLEPPP